MKKSSLAAYSFAHFFVDFVCAFLMIRFAGTHCALPYNFCAFAMQMPLGVLADRFRKFPIFAASGCGLVAVSFALFQAPMAMAVVAGLGNALFHIGGGADVLVNGKDRLAPLGIFVSPGALGLYFGGYLARESAAFSSVAAPLLLILCAAGALLPILRRHDIIRLAIRRSGLRIGGSYTDCHADKNGIIIQAHTLAKPLDRRALAAVVCAFLVVAARGFAGLTFAPQWKAGWPGLLLVVMVVLGKCAGGFLADAAGAKRAVLASLTLAGVLFFIAEIPAAGLAGSFLLNISMPVTLWFVSRQFPAAKGFSFGLLTFALFIGYLPVYFGATLPPGRRAPLALASALLMGASLFLGEKGLQNGTAD